MISRALTALASAMLAFGCTQRPHLTAEKTELHTGEDVVVTIEGGDLGVRAYDHYWIALQPADSPEANVTGRIVLDHDEHEVRFRTSAPGAYEVRLHDRYPKVESHLVARLPIRVEGYLVKTGAPAESGRP